MRINHTYYYIADRGIVGRECDHQHDVFKDGRWGTDEEGLMQERFFPYAGNWDMINEISEEQALYLMEQPLPEQFHKSKAVIRAVQICLIAHRDQHDKARATYISHPMHLATQMGTDEDLIITALLHDVFEDYVIPQGGTVSSREYVSNGTTALQIDFTPEIMEALKLLTHDDNVDYFEYLKPIKNNSIARKVKLADLRHNSDLSRISTVTDRDRERVAKYSKAIAFLEE